MPSARDPFDPEATSVLQLASIVEAEHFCRPIPPGVPYKTSALKGFLSSLPKKNALYTEGNSDFEQIRAILLSDSERSLFLATSNFRRAHDLLLTGSASWCLVTLYYSAFHAAESILAMFGGFVDREVGTVEIANGTAHKQELMVYRQGKKRINVLTSARGTHEIFWDVFFKSVQGLRSFIDSRIADGLVPVLGDAKWLTETRNGVNYSPFSSISLCKEFAVAFDPKKFPESLPPKLSETHAAAFKLVRTALLFSNRLKLKTDALDPLPRYKSRPVSFRDHIFLPRPPDWSKLGVRLGGPTSSNP